MYECTQVNMGAEVVQWWEPSPPTSVVRVRFRPDAINELSLLLVLALFQGFFLQALRFLTLQISIRPGYRTNMKSTLGGIAFLSKCCNLFILRFEKPSKRAKPFKIILKVLLRRKFCSLFSVFSEVYSFYRFKLIKCVRIQSDVSEFNREIARRK